MEYTKKTIRTLSREDSAFTVTCVVISKWDARFYEQKKTEKKCGVFTITVRDSIRDYQNCKIFASAERIRELYSLLNVGTVVQITNPVLSTLLGDRGEQLQPSTSSPFYLTVSEARGNIEVVDDVENYQRLCHLPLRQTTVLQLMDVSEYGEQVNPNEYVDLMVVVRYMRPTKEIVLPRSKETRKCRTLIVMDKTYSTMSLQLWSTSVIERADRFKPLMTVLYMSDVRVKYSEYFKAITLVESAKTVIIEDVGGEDAQDLLVYASNTTLDNAEFMFGSDAVDVSKISTVMTVQQIQDKASNVVKTNGEQFSALCYAIITKLDVDGLANVISKRCTNCKRYLARTENECVATECYTQNFMDGLDGDHGSVEHFFNIDMQISDHTGTLINCKLTKKFAEKILGITTAEFDAMSAVQRGELKWRFLLNRCAIKMVVKKESVCRSVSYITVLDMQPVNQNEFADNAKIY